MHQFYINPTRHCPTLPTLLVNHQNSSSYTTDDVDILKWILYSYGFKFSYKDISPSARLRTMISTLLFNYQGVLNRSIEDIDITKQILYLSGFNMSCKDFSPGYSGVNFNCKDFSPLFSPYFTLVQQVTSTSAVKTPLLASPPSEISYY